MSTRNVPQNPPLLEGNLLASDRSPLEESFLNPLQGNPGITGVPGALDTARRRLALLIGVFTLPADDFAPHPLLDGNTFRKTVRDELYELDSILELTAQQVETVLEAQGAQKEATPPAEESQA